MQILPPLLSTSPHPFYWGLTYMPEWQYNGVQTALSQKTPNTWKKEKEAEWKATGLLQNAPRFLEKYLPHLKRMNSWVMFTLPAKERGRKCGAIGCIASPPVNLAVQTAMCYETHLCLLTPSKFPDSFRLLLPSGNMCTQSPRFSFSSI